MAIFNFLKRTKEKELGRVDVFPTFSENFLSVSDEALKYWTFVAIDVIAKQAFHLEYFLYDKNGETVSHPLVEKFFRRPNPFETGKVFLYRVLFQLEAVGKSFIVAQGDNFFIIPNPDAVVINSDQAGIRSYTYAGVSYDRRNVLYIRYPHPFRNFEAFSRLQAMRIDLSIQETFKKSLQEVIESFSSMRGFISVKDYTLARLIEEGIRRARFSKQVPILPEAEPQRLFLTPEEAQLKTISDLIRDTILEYFGIPPSIVGVYQDVNRANALASLQSFRELVISPRLSFLEQSLQVELVDELISPDYTLELSISKIKDDELEHQKTIDYLKNGVLTINEVRIQEGYEPVSWGDRPWMPASYLQLEYSGGTFKNKQFSDMFEKNWFEFVQKAGTFEKKLVKIWQKIFRRQREAVLELLNLSKEVKEFAEKQSILYILNRVSQEEIDEVIEELINLYSEQSYRIASVFHLNVPVLAEPLLRATAQKVIKISGIDEYTLELIRSALQEGLSAGESISEIAMRVANVFDFCESYRAIRIARTETIGMSNLANLDTYRENGITQKQWYTALDERVRESHRALHGQTVAIDDFFLTPNGVRLYYPGDPDGTPEEVVNCRCTIVPI